MASPVVVQNIISNEDYGTINKKQLEAKEILNVEEERLKNKKSSVQTERYTLNRVLLLNNSRSLLMKDYLMLLMIVFVVAGVSLLILYIEKVIGFKHPLLDVFLAIFVALGIIGFFNTIMDINRHDKIDYEKINQGNLASTTNFSKHLSGSTSCNIFKRHKTRVLVLIVADLGINTREIYVFHVSLLKNDHNKK